MKDDFEQQLFALDEDEQKLVLDIARAAVRVLRSEKGAMLIVCDETGDGDAMLLACGNQFIVGPMLAAAQSIGGRFFADSPEVVQ